ncbi:hypothetical protein [Aquimarina sp. 2201CG5-10]|nr:hypothetical protein [Aquimarina sp. 2201CG5-10]MDY8137777.1 hypothetical protein [Aquimarina sp. 2201CG5-10]
MNDIITYRITFQLGQITRLKFDYLKYISGEILSYSGDWEYYNSSR